MDCAKDTPIRVDVWSVSRMGDKNDARASCLYERIDDPAVAAVRVRVCWRDFDAEEEVYNTAFIVTTTAAD